MMELNEMLSEYKKDIAQKEKKTFGNHKKDSYNSAFSGVSKKKGETKKDETNAAQKVSEHITLRILTDECYRVVVNDMLNVLPLDPVAICIKDGPFSPVCKRAQERRESQPKKPAQIEGDIGVEFTAE